MTPQQAQTLAAYNQWINRNLYTACATLDEAERRRDRGAFFKSLHGTLNHLLLADRLWLARFRGGRFAVSGLDQELYADFDTLRGEREATDADLLAWTATLDTDRLAAELRYASMVRPEPRCYPLWLALTHLFNHQTHHRGQVTALLSQCGVDYGVTDLILSPMAPD